jgi:ABC-2 type transport system ATP-binding protein
MALTVDHLVVIGQGKLLADATPQALSARSSSLEDAFLELTAGSVDYRARTS